MSANHLLIIDDDSRLTSMVGDYLRDAGFEVTTAGSRSTWASASRAWTASRATSPGISSTCSSCSRKAPAACFHETRSWIR